MTRTLSAYVAVMCEGLNLLTHRQGTAQVQQNAAHDLLIPSAKSQMFLQGKRD